MGRKIIDAEFKNKLKDRWNLFRRLHKLILSLNKEVGFDIFPIYIIYHLGEKNLALLYFKGKFVAGASFNLGLNLKDKPKIEVFVSAKYMKYLGITYSIKLQELDVITPEITKIIKSVVRR